MTTKMQATRSAIGDNGYSASFYLSHQDASLRSAREIVPLVLDTLHPASVIDVGCGIGTWLSVFMEHGIEDVLGTDNGWVRKELLQIPEKRFLQQDLEKHFSLPRKFDLVISIEVAEHLAPGCAETFVETLTGLGSIVLFSAAVPYQGGVHHVNEQWPEYWAGLFRERGYFPVDCLREKIRGNADVQWWHRQNLILYVRKDHPALGGPFAGEVVSSNSLSMVDRDLYMKIVGKYEALLIRVDSRNLSLRQLLRAMPQAVVRAVLRRIRPADKVAGANRREVAS
ncbi:MAG: hypothetical protein JWO80_1240 [Bryobacterales bacterium]|nr:hypothetical protein [Bryobacterales bacterium]